jgi:hypothetical protein
VVLPNTVDCPIQISAIDLISGLSGSGGLADACRPVKKLWATVEPVTMTLTGACVVLVFATMP